MITIEKLLKFCDVLNKYGVKYILIGGCAIILHGLERITYDIDIIIENSEENVSKIKEALRLFLEDNELKELNSNVINKYQVVRVGLEDYYVDLLTKVSDIDYEIAKQDILVEKISGIEIPVAGVDTMIKLKEGLREIDIKDRLFLIGKKEYLKGR